MTRKAFQDFYGFRETRFTRSLARLAFNHIERTRAGTARCQSWIIVTGTGSPDSKNRPTPQSSLSPPWRSTVPPTPRETSWLPGSECIIMYYRCLPPIMELHPDGPKREPGKAQVGMELPACQTKHR